MHAPRPRVMHESIRQGSVVGTHAVVIQATASSIGLLLLRFVLARCRTRSGRNLDGRLSVAWPCSYVTCTWLRGVQMCGSPRAGGTCENWAWLPMRFWLVTTHVKIGRYI